MGHRSFQRTGPTPIVWGEQHRQGSPNQQQRLQGKIDRDILHLTKILKWNEDYFSFEIFRSSTTKFQQNGQTIKGKIAIPKILMWEISVVTSDHSKFFVVTIFFQTWKFTFSTYELIIYHHINVNSARIMRLSSDIILFFFLSKDIFWFWICRVSIWWDKNVCVVLFI